MSGLMMIRDNEDVRMGNMLTIIADAARARGFTADVVSAENEIPQTLALHHEYSNPANLFTFFYPNSDTVIEKGKAFAKAKYEESVRSIVQQVQNHIEEGEHEDVEDVNSDIEGYVNVYDTEDALEIFNSSDSREYIFGNPKTGETIVDMAWRMKVRDVTESLGDIQQLIDDSLNITEADKDEIFNLMADAVSYALRDSSDLMDSVVEEYTDKEKKQEQLIEYIQNNASKILRQAAERW